MAIGPRALGFACVVALLLAGCSAKPAPTATLQDAAPVPEQDLKATATTGVIRGVVVDEGVRPLAGVTLSLMSEGKTMATNSTATGGFGFQGLKPGTYFVKAHKLSYHDQQVSAEVKAGDSTPAITKIGMAADTSFVKPYAVSTVFKGFMDCGLTTPAVGIAVCSVPNGPTCGNDPVPCTGNVTSDHFATFIPVDGGVPQWIQHELVWKATQSAGEQFSLTARTATQAHFSSGSYDKDLPDQPLGISPLLAQVNTTTIHKYDIGRNGTGLAPAVFAGGVPGTGDQVCVPGQFCLFDTGVTLEQDFTMYTHIWYGFTPPAGYRFTNDGEPKPPE